MKPVLVLLAVSALAFGQVPPMIPSAPDGGPVGGAGNLTTVGSVPYVSASGILNQDAGQFVWDATNNRLGIGTATPSVFLNVSGASTDTVNFHDTTAIAANIGAGLALGGNYLGTTVTTWAAIQSGKNNATSGDYGGYLGLWTRANGSPNAERMRIDSTGNVGIGTTTPVYLLDVAKSGASGTARFYDQTATTGSTLASFRAGIAQSTNPVLTVNNNANTVVFSVNSTGNVGIGAATPTVPLEVLGNGRFYSSVANPSIFLGEDTTNATSASIAYNRSTANLDITPRSTYATNLAGKLKFSITNSTGAGSALLGTNSPAITLTAPYTWITVTTSDGSTGYMPIWK